jgi:2-phospho-L-lactate guanylyltransferase (CobY/MobA/RfbA family)
MAALMARIVTVQVICPDSQAHDVAEKMHHVVIGFGLAGLNSSLTMESCDDNEDVIVFTSDGDS